MNLIISTDSHLDHGVTGGHIKLVVNALAGVEPTKFGAHILELNIPDKMMRLRCDLRGPAVGMAPVKNDEVVMRVREGRKWPSRMLKSSDAFTDPLYVHKMVAIVGPDGLLYTVYGGPLAPREPGDPSLTPDERVDSEKFWSEHALVL